MRNKISYLLGAALCVAACSGKQEVIDDFESGNLDQWVVEGSAFLDSPKNAGDYPDITGSKGQFFVGSLFDEDNCSPSAYGVMTSRAFTITKDYVNFLLGGTSSGLFRRYVSVELLVDGKCVRTAYPHGNDPKELKWHSWNVNEYRGSLANIRIRVDSVVTPRPPKASRYILVDQIGMSDSKVSTYNDILSTEIVAQQDYLLIPSSNSGSVSRFSIVADGKNILGEVQDINLAHGSADYYIPVDISAWKGRRLKVILTGVDDRDLSVTGMKQGPDRGFVREEPYRQVYHFTPDFGWTNDPNGMVYHDGEYHLAYQANPYGTKHFNMHWGNAVSTDLVHWTDLPFIVAPDSLGAIFSGSSVVDTENSAGFGKDAIIAMYTSAGRHQQQSIAYSTDRGRTYTKYEGNPVIPEKENPDFRDPKMMRYGDGWIVSVAAGDVIAFYGSKDLKEWEHLSDFGRGIGSHAAVWECPDLMRFEWNGQEKWVLIVNINPGGPNGGSVAQYFIGQFDGRSFKADPLPYPLWIDEGTDNYAGVTFSNTGDRHIFLGWMSNWLYSNEVPTVNFRNSMTIARDLSLKHNGRHLFLASVPSPEIYSARVSSTEVAVPDLKTGDFTVASLLPDNRGAYEIDFTVIPGRDNMEMRLFNGKGEEMVYTFDFENLTLNLDRSRSGLTDFYEGFAKSDILTHLVRREAYDVKLFVDRHSTEMFVGDGDLTFTNTMFPTEVYDSLSFSACDAVVSGLVIHEIQ